MKNFPNKAILIMSTTAFWTFLVGCLFATTLLANNPTSAQSIKDVDITVEYDNATLSEVFEDIESKTNFTFLYHSLAVLSKNERVNIKHKQSSVAEILKNVSTQVGIQFWQLNNTIAVKCLYKPIKEEASFQAGVIKGTVINAETGEPMPGASVYCEGTTIGAATNKEGEYKITGLEPGEYTLIAQFIGYKSEKRKITIETNDTLNVDFKLTPKSGEIDELVVTGIVTRDAESFTGTVTSFEDEELKMINSGNVIEALATLDPSFNIVENNQLGDDPNRLPDIEIRGRTNTPQEIEDKFGRNPNLPLFILNGFKASLRTIIDLDMERIKSVTILKDAASTAIYGAQAANGVVVVETKQPKGGKMLINYSVNGKFSFPDLSSYNMMSAEQLLEFQRLSGYYDVGYPSNKAVALDSIYNARLQNVRRGINTDWLHIPVHTGYTQKHSLSVGGGGDLVQYRLGVDYKHNEGVMKGSGRNEWGANLDVVYRVDKLNVKNNLYFSGYDAFNSPYGSFSQYARANPYFMAQNPGGEINRYLNESFHLGNTSNPYYNAHIANQKNQNQNLLIRNNLQLNYDLNNKFRFKGALQIVRGQTKGTVYIPPEHTMFDNVGLYEKGRYTHRDNNRMTYEGNVMFTYADVFKDKHRLTTNVRASVENTQRSRLGFIADGFPAGSNGNPRYAFGYKKDSSPEVAREKFRRIGLLGSVNYSYDQRYLLDATYRLDGSTSFGSENQYSPFWAVGVGWKVSNEAFFNSEVINLLRLRASIGITGNQNFGNISSLNTYIYRSDTNIFGQGVGISSVGNPDLEWQKTRQANISLDLNMFNNRINAVFSAYQNRTDPLVVFVNQALSTGIIDYPMNAGVLTTRGLEGDFKIQPISQNNLVWTLGVNASMIRTKYSKFDRLINSLNERAIQNSSLIRYKNGYSPDAIWAVHSGGIDPATGQEMFITSEGDYTYTYDPRDIQVAGNSRPTIKGVISNRIRYKDFYVNLSIRYSFGADVMNNALYNKVENISSSQLRNNQDARALTERWKKPGDVTRFKSIEDATYTPISSRFIQKENYIKGESISLGYRTSSASWLNEIGLNNLWLSITMNDIFRISSIRAERGIDYPFARSVTGSLKVTF